MSGTIRKRRGWSFEEDALLRDLYPSTRTSALPRRLGRSASAIKNRVAALHLRKHPDVSMRRPWTRAEDRLLRKLYPESENDVIVKQLNRTVYSLYNRAKLLGLRKSKAFCARKWGARLATAGAPFRYPAGHVPANKGLRRPGWSPGRMKETQFKKGQVPRNWKPVGSQRLVGGYLYTKISDERYVPWTRTWKPTHVLLWEKHRGPVPRRHAVAFVNGDHTDIRLANLELISRRTLMARNTVHNLPAPLPQTIQLLGALKRKINRKAKNEKQDRRSA